MYGVSYRGVRVAVLRDGRAVLQGSVSAAAYFVHTILLVLLKLVLVYPNTLLRPRYTV
jgi:hypothetical protein